MNDAQHAFDQFSRAWLRGKRHSGTVSHVVELAGEELTRELAVIFWRYGVMHERGTLLLDADGEIFDPESQREGN